MTITMYDSIQTQLIPADAQAAAGYVGGMWPNYSAIKARLPKANVLSVAINSSEDADCLDIENGDAVPADAAAWVGRQHARGIARPCLYASASAMPAVLADLSGPTIISRTSVRLWSAHYTNTAHICGPSSCGQMTVNADGTQWTDVANGLDLDESLLMDNFFGGSAPSVTYANVTGSFPVLTSGVNDTDLPHWYVHRAQAILNAVYAAGLTVDGSYGPASAAAVKSLQAHYGLAQDGICGPATWTKLIAGLCEKPQVPLLQEGQQHEAALQSQGLQLDCLRALQEEHQLVGGM